jgi:hypothetical protein
LANLDLDDDDDDDNNRLSVRVCRTVLGEIDHSAM